MSRIGLIDYGMGNLHSVARAIERLGAEVVPIQNGAAMEDCHALILPGVGAFDPAMHRLERSGLAKPIQSWSGRGRPLLGICLGLQLLFEASDEGDAQGLGLLKGRVQALPNKPDQPVPHMGWAPLIASRPTPLLPPGCPPAWVYFVHSYAAAPAEASCQAAAVAFGDSLVTAAVWQGHLAACQFHPEKSGLQGQGMLRRWLNWVESEDR